MGLFADTMRLGRKTTARLEKNYADYRQECNKLDKLKGSALYIETVEKLQQRYDSERKRIVDEAKTAFEINVDNMRQNLSNRLTKAPTTDQVNTLMVLRTLDNVTPREMQLYAAQMSNCPLALKSLTQYAAGHNMRLNAPDADAIMGTVDVIEWHLSALCQYTGNEDEAPASLRMTLKYFRSDGDYQTMNAGTRDIDRKFWTDVVQIGSPEMLDADGSFTPAEPQYFFRDVDDMLMFMRKATEGLDEKAAEDKCNEILQNCPGQYGAAYRYYKSSGKKVPLMDNGETQEPNDGSESV